MTSRIASFWLLELECDGKLAPMCEQQLTSRLASSSRQCLVREAIWLMSLSFNPDKGGSRGCKYLRLFSSSEEPSLPGMNAFKALLRLFKSCKGAIIKLATEAKKCELLIVAYSAQPLVLALLTGVESEIFSWYEDSKNGYGLLSASWRLYQDFQ